MRWVKKTGVKLFRLSFRLTDPVEKVEFSTGSPSRKTQSKKVESKKPYFDCVRKPDLGFSRKRPFSTDKSDCIRNGLKVLFWRKLKFLLPLCLKFLFFGIPHTS